MATGVEIVERVDSHNLRDFLRIKEEDHRSNLAAASSGGGVSRSSLSGLTLNDVLTDKIRPARPAAEPLQRVQSNRTLLDIIRDDQTSGMGGAAVHRDSKRKWRHLKEKILLRHHRGGGGGSTWTSTVPTPTSDIPINNRMTMMTRQSSARFNSNPNPVESGISAGTEQVPDLRERPSGRFEHTSSLPARRSLQREINAENLETAETAAAVVEMAEGEAGQPVRMSLMSLLAETDRQMGVEGSAAYLMNEDEEEVEVEESGGAAVDGGGYNNCCVCMVRHKGAAFIPCGHTFCRLCSRELWAQRGNCPLCNNYILEILDIF